MPRQGIGRSCAAARIRRQFLSRTRLEGTVAFSGEETAAAAGLVAEACVDSGFRRLLFVNGHVGNAAPLWIACDRFRRESRAADRRHAVVGVHTDIARRATEDAVDWHANAAETSLMLVLRPNSSTPTECVTPTIPIAPRASSSATRCSTFHQRGHRIPVARVEVDGPRAVAPW